MKHPTSITVCTTDLGYADILETAKNYGLDGEPASEPWKRHGTVVVMWETSDWGDANVNSLKRAVRAAWREYGHPVQVCSWSKKSMKLRGHNMELLPVGGYLLTPNFGVTYTVTGLNDRDGGFRRRFDDFVEALGWEIKGEGRSLTLETRTPLGEDWVLPLGMYGDEDENLFQRATAAWVAFDVDEAAAALIEHRCEPGFPSSCRDIVEDQEWKRDKLKELMNTLSGSYTPDI